MLDVTAVACEMLAKKLVESQARDGEVMRVFASGEGLALEMGQIEADDRAIRHDDRLILAVAQNVSEVAHNRTLDVVATAQGPRLTFTQRAISEPDLRTAHST